MPNLPKTTVFTFSGFQNETPLDKVTRTVRRTTEDEADVFHKKTTRLRKASFKSKAGTPEL